MLHEFGNKVGIASICPGSGTEHGVRWSGEASITMEYV